jgi:hypothetical protein
MVDGHARGVRVSPYLQHGRRHAPGGTDPILDVDNLSWHTPGWNVNLPLWGDDAAANFAGTIDATRIHNWKLSHSGVGSDSMTLGPFNCFPGFYVIAIASATGPAYGTMTLDVAGAYALVPDWFAAGPASGDWVNIGTWDFSAAVDAVYNNYIQPGPASPYTPVSGYDGASTFAAFGMDGGVSDDGADNIYTKAASIVFPGSFGEPALRQAGGITPAGGGYYFLRATCTGLIELSDMLLLNGGFPI